MTTLPRHAIGNAARPLWMVLALCLILTAADAQASTEADVDSLYRSAVEQVGQVPAEETVAALEAVVQIDPEHHAAWHELAKAYMALLTPAARLKAERALGKALRGEPENVDYLITQMNLLWDQGLHFDAERKCREVLELDPENAEAVYTIGYRAALDAVKYRWMYGEGMTWTHWAERDADKAVEFLGKAIELNPDLSKAYYRMAMVYYDQGKLDRAADIAESLLRRHPDDAVGLLIAGLAREGVGEADNAAAYYAKAMARIPDDQRRVMQAEAIRAAGASAEGRPRDEAADDFWTRVDPLFLTEESEWEREFYSRVAFAALMFGVPEKGIPGWETDKGRSCPELFVNLEEGVFCRALPPGDLKGGDEWPLTDA